MIPLLLSIVELRYLIAAELKPVPARIDLRLNTEGITDKLFEMDRALKFLEWKMRKH
jgi:hypothetical protein